MKADRNEWIKSLSSVIIDAASLGRKIGIPITEEHVDRVLELISHKKDEDFSNLEIESICHGFLYILAQNGLKNPIPESLDTESLAEILERTATEVIKFNVLRAFGIGGSEIGQANKSSIARRKFMGVLDGRDAEIDFVDSIFSRSLFKGTFRGHVFEAAMNAKVHDAVSGGNITFHSVPFPDAEVILPSHRFIRGNVDAFVIRPSQYQKSEVAEVLGEEDAAILMNGKDFVQAPKLAVVDYKALNNGERDKVMSSYSKQVALYAIKAGGLMEKAMLHELLSGIARESGSDVDSGWITEKVDAFYDRFNEDNPERAIRIATMMDLGFTVGLMEPKHGEMAGNLLNAVSTMDIKKIRDALEAIRSDFLDGATIQKYMMDYREKRDNLTMAEHDYRQFELAVESLLQLRTPDQDNGDERNNGMGADKEIKRELIDQIKKQEAALAKIKLQLDSLTKEYNDGRERLLRLMSEAGVESFSTHVDGFDKVEGIVCTPKKTIVDIKAARERISIGLEEASERIGDIKDRQLESLVKSISGVSPSLKECVHVDEGKPYIKFTAVPEKGLQPSIMSEPQVP